MKELISQSAKVKWTCDGCGFEKVYEAVNPTPSELEEMCGWATLTREDSEGGQVSGRIVLNAHTPQCISGCLDKLYKPIETSDSNIDLSQLQAANGNIKVN